MKLSRLSERTTSALPFFFNLSGPVGKGYPHAHADDVAFVQFCFAATATSTLSQPADVQAVWAKVTVNGLMNKETQDGIDAWDADRRKRFGRLIDADGIVSVAPDGVVSYSGGTAYTIAHLNFVLMMAAPSIWPRLDKHNLSTPALGSAIRAAISGHLTA